MVLTNVDLLNVLRCPACHGDLVACDGGVSCRQCGAPYAIRRGIPCFAEPDPFYDGYAAEHCPFTPTPKGWRAVILRALPFWSYREWRFWRQAVPLGGRLLDLGAGQGKEIFIERADETVGLDGSLVFLEGCLQHYDAAVLASMPRLPFANRCFDVVVSSHVFGHIRAEDKEVLLAEIARVLRPGGVTAHIIETDSEHPIVRGAKQDPDLYRRQLIEQDGHIGLEPAARVLERFARHGFSLELRRMVDAIVPSVLYYDKYLDHPGYRGLPKLGWTRLLRRLNAAGPLGNLLYEFGFGAYHRTIEQWFGRLDRANFLHVAFRKN